MDTIQVTFRNKFTGGTIKELYLHQVPRVGDDVDPSF